MSDKGTNIWCDTLKDYKIYLKLERSLSANTITSYSSDINKFFIFIQNKGLKDPDSASEKDLSDYLYQEGGDKISKRSQSRLISSLKSLYKFLEMEGRIEESPAELVDTPKLDKYLPEVLSVEEIEEILSAVDLSQAEGHRNKAIIETLYSCGLRVSELVSLRVSDLFFDEQFIRVIGKGNKQRLVPIGDMAIEAIEFYLRDRKLLNVDKSCDDILFLNRRGRKLTREMIFLIVKKLCEKAGIRKNVSPHTFRHSFATHLVENGADLRVVQEMLGHESILTTEIYTHIDSQKWKSNILDFHPKR